MRVGVSVRFGCARIMFACGDVEDVWLFWASLLNNLLVYLYGNVRKPHFGEPSTNSCRVRFFIHNFICVRGCCLMNQL